MEELSNQMKIIIAVIAALFIGLIFWVFAKIKSKKQPNENTVQIDVFGATASKDSVLDFKDLMNGKKYLGEEQTDNPFKINEKEKDARYEAALMATMTGDSLKNVNNRDNEDAIIDSILNANTVSKQKITRPTSYSNPRKYNPYDKQAKKAAEEKTQLELLEEERQRFKNTFKKRDRTKTTTNNNQAVLKTDRVLYAEIDGDQYVTEDDRMKMILKKQATVNGIIIPKGMRFFGTVSFASHRIYINVTNINNVPIKLKVYDNEDGSIGVYSKRKLMTKAKDEAIDDQVNSVDSKGVKILDSARKIFKKNKVEKVYMLNKQPLLIK